MLKRGPEPEDLFPDWLALFAKHHYRLTSMPPKEQQQVRVWLQRLRIVPLATTGNEPRAHDERR